MHSSYVPEAAKNYDVSRVAAVARTPKKLTDMLLAKSIPQATLDAKLHITQGDVRDAAAVQSTLVHNSKPVNTIVSGIGMIVGRNADMTICQDSTREILNALGQLALPTAQRPFLTVISTTGISNGPRDVPLLFTPLYHVALATPHKDKRVMEELVVEAGREGTKISGYCLVRPSLLIDWKNPGALRVGSEAEPAVGYTIKRDDVGKWIFEECIQGDPQRWKDTKPTLTY